MLTHVWTHSVLEHRTSGPIDGKSTALTTRSHYLALKTKS